MSKAAANSGARLKRKIPTHRQTGKKKKQDSAGDSQPQPADDTLYAIRDIIGEKYLEGKLYYKIDWADHPQTGESYKPTWEPAENATDKAVAEWEHRNRARKEDSGNDSQPARPTKRVKTTQHPDITSVGNPDELGSWRFVDHVPRSRGKVVVKIPSRPSFDTSAYVAIDPDELPQESQRDQENKGGISQITIPDSQALTDSLEHAGLDRLPESIADSSYLGSYSQEAVPPTPDLRLDDLVHAENVQEPDEAFRQAQGDQLPENARRWEASQTADFEEPQPVFNNQIAEIQPELLEELVIEGVQPLIVEDTGSRVSQPGTDHIHSNYSSSQIPSRQPEHLNPDSGPSTDLEKELNSSPRFLTQPEFDLPLLEDFSSPGASKLSLSGAVDSHKSHRVNSQSAAISATNSLLSQLATPSQQQAAQVVAPIQSNTGHIRTQSQEFSDNECEVVPETAQKNVARADWVEPSEVHTTAPATEPASCACL